MAETINNIFAIIRGMVKKIRLGGSGALLRCEKGVRVMKNNGAIIVGRRVFLHRHVKLSASGAGEKAVIEIGDKSYIGDNTEIHAGKSVKIGSGVNIAWGCSIMDRDYHKFCSDKESVKGVVIENHVWIGCNCTVLKGVTIGEGAVIAAGSVVTKSVPPRTLAAGNPAKVIRENVTWQP